MPGGGCTWSDVKEFEIHFQKDNRKKFVYCD